MVLLDTIKTALSKYPHVSTFAELVSATRGTILYDEVANIYLDTRADKIWTLARDDIIDENEHIDLMDLIRKLPENDDQLSPEQTLALFNSWCEEQHVNGTKVLWYLISRLQGRAYKKIGIFYHGASNAGKTFWTSRLFKPLSNIIGRMTTGGRFTLQNCERKKIVIGEEIGITLDNVDRLKELMSGEVTTCERKCRSVVRCKASLVLMNANSLPAANVPQERAALMNRMLLIKNLKPSQIIEQARRGTTRTEPNLKFLLMIKPPTDEQLQELNENIEPDEMMVRDTEGRLLKFHSTWEEWYQDEQFGPHQNMEKKPETTILVSDSPDETAVQVSQSTLCPSPIIIPSSQLDNHEDDDNIWDIAPMSTTIGSRWIKDPSPTKPHLFNKKFMPYMNEDFCLSEDFQLVHMNVTDEEPYTDVEYSMIINTKRQHLLTVRIPRIHKMCRSISDLYVDISSSVKLETYPDALYIRTVSGMSELPVQPDFNSDIFTTAEEKSLENLFVMLVNRCPTKPVYRRVDLSKNSILQYEENTFLKHNEVTQCDQFSAMLLENSYSLDELTKWPAPDNDDCVDGTQDTYEPASQDYAAMATPVTADEERDHYADMFLNEDYEQSFIQMNHDCLPPIARRKIIRFVNKVLKGVNISFRIMKSIYKILKN